MKSTSSITEVHRLQNNFQVLKKKTEAMSSNEILQVK